MDLSRKCSSIFSGRGKLLEVTRDYAETPKSNTSNTTHLGKPLMQAWSSVLVG